MTQTAVRSAVALLTLLAACRGASTTSKLPSARPEPVGSPDVTIACVAIVADSPRPRVPLKAALIISLRHEPPSRPASEGSVRIEGETSRSTVKIDPASPARFELAPGLYDVRVAQERYGNVTARISLAAGCTATFNPVLRGRTVRVP